MAKPSWMSMVMRISKGPLTECLILPFILDWRRHFRAVGIEQQGDLNHQINIILSIPGVNKKQLVILWAAR